MRTRLDPQERKKQILRAGCALARKHGVDNITRVMVADKLGISHGMVNRYFGDRKKFREAVAKTLITI